MNRFYVYKMTVDNGGAPCIQQGVLSLAICKPRIRKTAKKGDVVFGFAANQLGDAVANNALIYVAEVTDSVRGEEYYSRKKFSRRPDCIYEWNGMYFSRRKGAKFHNNKDDLKHDLGVYPGYIKAQILLSEKFRYFREESPITLRTRTQKFPCLSRLIGSLTQGERVNHPSELRAELERLLALVWRCKSAYSATRIPKSTCYDSCRDERQKITIC
jgi:hypothetical protein